MKNVILMMTVMMSVQASAQSGFTGTTRSDSRSCPARLNILAASAENIGAWEKRFVYQSIRASGGTTKVVQARLKGSEIRLKVATIEFRDQCMAGNALTCSESLDSFVTQNRQKGRIRAVNGRSANTSTVQASIARHRDIVTGCMIEEETSNSSSGTASTTQLNTSSGQVGRGT